MLECALSRLFGPSEKVRFLETEREHAEDEAVAGQLGTPRRQSVHDAIAQEPLLAEREVGDVRDLQREKIGRMVEHDLSVELARAVKVAVEPGPSRGKVTAFSLVRALQRAALRPRCLVG